jgi:hypothetical protein
MNSAAKLNKMFILLAFHFGFCDGLFGFARRKEKPMTFETAMAAVKCERKAWQAYLDAQTDHDVLRAMNARNKVVASDEEVEAAKAKSSQLMSDWYSLRKEARSALDDLLAPLGLKRGDIAGLCS